MSLETKKLQEKIAELEALLEKRTKELSIELTDNVIFKSDLDKKTIDLNQRIRELKAVQHISTLSDSANLPLEDFYAYVLKVIVSGLRYPHIACAELQLGEKHFTTDKFSKSPWKIGRALADQKKMFGYLTVYYLEELPEADNGPFTKEEQDLIVVMTRYLSHITRRKQFEKESRMVNTVISQSSSAIIITDAAGVTQYLNNAFTWCMGFTQKEMEGNPAVRFMDCLVKDEENLKIIDELVKTNKAGNQWHGEIRVKRKDDKVIWISAVAFPLFDNQNLKSFAAIFRDVTEQKTREALIDIMNQIDSLSNITASLDDSLKIAFHYLRQIDWIDAIGIYLFDDDRKYLRLKMAEGLSDEFLQLVGSYAVEEAPAQIVIQGKVIYAGEEVLLETIYKNTIKEGLTMTASIPLIYRDEVIGCLNLASRHYTGINSLNQQVIESIASRLATLITLVKTRKQLRQTNEELLLTIKKISENQQLLIQKSKLESLGELSAGMAHEINQPLSVISLVTENMELQLTKDKVSKDYMQKKISSINENIHKIRELIDHVRIFSRDQGSILFEKVDVNQAIQSALSLVSAQLSHHNITVTRELGDNLGYTLGNPSRLEQVIFNLISNARDALDENEKLKVFDMPEKEIVVSTTHVNNNIIIRIRDNGTGISPEKFSQVFNPFFTTKEAGKGTGLGLSIVYGIINEMKGDIKIESELNQFTEVTVSLPRYSGAKKK
ncbi:MAG: PAS domain S-box protein [Bacteroidales bacterium]|nr:PAS domain S-box protein [Bacteroidales bacterium]